MGKCADEKVLRSAEVHGPHGPRRLFPAIRPFSAWQAYLKGAHKHPLLLVHAPRSDSGPFRTSSLHSQHRLHFHPPTNAPENRTFLTPFSAALTRR